MRPQTRNALVKQLVARGIHVHLSPGIQGFTYRRLRMVPIAYEPLLYLEPPDHSPFQLFLKRALDLVLSTIVLVIFAIPLAILMAFVRLQDGGPAIFKQERVGRNGELFTFLKLRTMVVDAEAKRAAIADTNERNGPLFKATDDPRVTRLGRILRATSLDELPQLINVLRGDMSLVGPRPCLPSEAAEFDDALSLRYEVRPGVTGLWQVEARDNPVFRAYRRFDLFYVENWTVGLDLVILVLTVQNVISRGVSAVLQRTGPSSETPASALP
jgi:lipopolysaccharide/colanic/teichoic acid biosynthesis glycosyltransferase